MARDTGQDKSGERSRKRRARRRLYLLGAAVAAAAVVVLVVVQNLGDGSDGIGGPVVLPSPRPAGLEEEGHVLGNADAPVTIVEYADFQ
jgi:protein-disulfide isomerase